MAALTGRHTDFFFLGRWGRGVGVGEGGGWGPNHGLLVDFKDMLLKSFNCKYFVILC